MGAFSEVYRVSPYAFYAFLFLLGQLSKRLDSIRGYLTRVISIGLFSITIVSLFQYNLRSNQWLLYALLLIFYIDRYILKDEK